MLVIVPLGTGHDRVAFDCGSAELNAFFKATARQHPAKGIHRTVLISAQAGGIGLFVDAKNGSARSFYEHYGFLALPGNPLHLFLPMETLHSITADPTENS